MMTEEEERAKMAKQGFEFSEEDCIKMILEFLENRDFNISQLSLERETGVTNGNYSDDLLFLRQLILDGQWEHVFEFIQPLESISTFDKRQVRYILNKYKYIELLCIKFEIGPFQNAENCVKKIVDCLAELEQYCPSKENYNTFCLLLTLENFGQHADYKNWNPNTSRIRCFNELFKHIEKFLPIIKKPGCRMPRSSTGDRLMQIIIKGLLYESCLEYCQTRAITPLDKQDDVNFVFANMLDETQPNRSDSSLISWLQAIPTNTFNFQFEDKKLNVKIEKLDKPPLIATWSEMMLTSPIKPQVFPHYATPFTRLRATDLMSKSLTSGIVDGLSKSIMSFSLKDAVDMSHSTIATAEFHLSQNNQTPSIADGPVVSTMKKKTVTSQSIANGDQTPSKDEKIMEKMFEQGNVFNSSMFGKLGTINEDKIANEKENRITSFSPHGTPNKKRSDINNRTFDAITGTHETNVSTDSNSIEEMKIKLEHFADTQWKKYMEEFSRKKDELLMSSMNRATANELRQTCNNDSYLTPLCQTGQSNLNDLQSMAKFTSTPKATPNQLESIKSTVAATISEYNPVRLNFSDISTGNSSCNTMIGTADLQNPTTKSKNTFDLDITLPKTTSNTDQRHLANVSNRFNNQHTGSNNSSLKSPNISLDSGVVAKSNSSVHLNGNQTITTNVNNSINTLNGGDKQLSHDFQTIEHKANTVNSKKDLNKGLFVELTKLEDVQAIRAVEFHPKGRYYAIGSNSKTLRICTYPYANEIKKDVLDLPIQPDVTYRRLKYHKGSIFCLGWNPNGELLATGSNDQTIKLVRFNQETCELIEETETVLQMHEATVRDLCFMQDSTNNNNLLISGGAGNCKIYITDCQTATPFQAFSGHSAPVLCLYNWGGAVFVSGSQDRTIRTWDLRSRGCANLITAPSVTGQGAGGAVSSVTVDPSGRLLVSGHDDASCMLYDIRGQRVIQTFKPHNGDIRSVRFSPKAYYLLSGGYDNNIVLTDLQGDLTQPLTSLVVAVHTDKVVQAKWHPTEFNFLSSSADKTAVLWSLPSS